MFILQCAGADLAPSADVNGVGPAPASIEPITVRPDDFLFSHTEVIVTDGEIRLFHAFQILWIDPIGK